MRAIERATSVPAYMTRRDFADRAVRLARDPRPWYAPLWFIWVVAWLLGPSR